MTQNFDGFPSEIWQIILEFLDLENQHFLSGLSKEFHHITLSLWRIRLVKILRKISSIPFDYNEARTNFVMRSFLNDKKNPIEKLTLSELHDVLCKYQAITAPEVKTESDTEVVTSHFIYLVRS